MLTSWLNRPGPYFLNNTHYLIRTFRALLRLFLFLIVTLFFFLLIVVSYSLRWVGVSYGPYRSYLLKRWGRSVASLLNISIHVTGESPKPPFLLVSNHLSYIDIFLLFATTNCIFVAKSDVLSWPVIGPVIKTCGMLFIDRENRRDVQRVNELIRSEIDEDKGVVLFPESTTSMGKDVLPFKSPLLQLAAEKELPVYFVALSYSTPSNEPPAYKEIAWWGDEPFFSHFFNALKVKQMDGYVTFGSEPLVDVDRKALAKRLHNGVSSLFIPLIDEKEYAKAESGSLL
ncbi:MAG: lysophospholipid acyltransferase family protein [Bacteroidota bacterium]